MNLTTREVAERCRITVDTVRVWIRQSRLRPVGKTGKGYLFSVSDVDALLAAGLRPAEPESTIVRDRLNAILSRRHGA